MAVVTKFPTTNAAYSGAGLTNPNNAHADDGVYATCAPAKNGALGQKYGTFGFDASIPSGATISAVKIIYEYKVSTTSSVATARTKAIIGGVDQANHDDTTEPTTDTVLTIDITADRTWNRNDLLDGTFEAVLEGRRGNSNTAVTFSFDYVKVEVTYAVAYTIAANQGGFTENGQAMTPLAARVITALNAVFSETGQDAVLVKGYPIIASFGSFSNAGQVAILRASRTITASQGSLTILGQAASILKNSVLSIVNGLFSLIGQSTALTYAPSGGESAFTKLCKRQIQFSLDGR